MVLNIIRRLLGWNGVSPDQWQLDPASEPQPLWVVFPDISAGEVHNQGAVDGYIEHVWLPFWMQCTEEQKSAYLDRYEATDEWREAIAFRYEWDGIDEDGDPISRTPTWLKRDK